VLTSGFDPAPRRKRTASFGFTSRALIRRAVAPPVALAASASLNGQLRRVAEDPLRSEWNEWLNNRNFAFKEANRFPYARIVFRDFRNSVQHRLDIARGREARRLGFDEPFFYANHAGSVRFGFYHPRFEQVLREVAAGLRAWALAERRDIFAR